MPSKSGICPSTSWRIFFNTWRVIICWKRGEMKTGLSLGTLRVGLTTLVFLSANCNPIRATLPVHAILWTFVLSQEVNAKIPQFKVPDTCLLRIHHLPGLLRQVVKNAL